MNKKGQIGQLRRTQLITTFGIGSIVDLRHYSAMICGQQEWKRLEVITEERLQKKLKVDQFKQPETINEQSPYPSVPCVRFPEWVFCKNCKTLNHVDGFGDFRVNKCNPCSKPGSPQPLTPTRFIVCCSKGHADDFPWIWWTHKGESCEKPQLKISATGRSTALSSIIVSCKNCEAFRSLAGIYRKYSLKEKKCTGRRPWLKDKEDCDETPVVLQRSSASVYFPIVDSAISIPPFSNKIFRFINEHKDLYLLPVESLRPVIEAILESTGETFDTEIIIKAIKDRKVFLEKKDVPDLRPAEYNALCHPEEKDPEADFFTSEEKVPEQLKDFISRVILVHKLREVRVLRGFNRIKSESIHISLLSTKKENWLPGIEVNGEGIFIELNPSRIEKWKKEGGKELEKRAKILENLRKKLRSTKKWSVTEISITPEFLLLHTFSHLLIQQLTIECGYASASLRERIYVSDDKSDAQTMKGFLIYTAAADAEGSLGGLVRQGKTDRLEELLIDTVKKAQWCSNDPLCIESSGQGIQGLNLAACHACTLLPETSCELRNINCFLDRGVVIGTPENPKIGYFYPIFQQ